MLLWLSDAHHISFLLNRFSVKYRFPFLVLLFLTAKSPSVTHRSVSQENAPKKSKNPSPFFFSLKHRRKWFFYSNWKQFQVFKKVKFEFKVTVHYSLWTKCIQLWPLKYVKSTKSKYEIQCRSNYIKQNKTCTNVKVRVRDQFVLDFQAMKVPQKFELYMWYLFKRR